MGPGDQFGAAVVALGDLNGDNIEDLAVGKIFDDDGGTDRGYVYILFLEAAGTLASYQKISSASSGSIRSGRR